MDRWIDGCIAGSKGGWIDECNAGSMGGWIIDRRNEMFYLTTQSTHFIPGCMTSDMW